MARFGLPPFIATLGMLNVARGLALVISELRPIYFPDQPGFNEFFMGSVMKDMGLPDMPNLFFIFVIAAVVTWFILGKTIVGRYIFAIGSNEDATRLSGVRTMRYKATAYIISGTMAGLAGVVLAARLNSAQPSTGFGYELDAIAAAVIGGTSLAGGEGTITGTIIGAFIISVLTNGLRLLGVPQEWQIDHHRRHRHRGGLPRHPATAPAGLTGTALTAHTPADDAQAGPSAGVPHGSDRRGHRCRRAAPGAAPDDRGRLTTC